MAPAQFFLLHIHNFRTNIRTQPSKLNLPYTTSLGTPKLSTIFSKAPSATKKLVSAEEKIQAKPEKAKSNQSKKARTLAGIINDNPWSARTVSHLSTITPLSQTTFFQTLRRIKTSSNALCFFKWAQDSGFSLTHQAYFMMLEILGRTRNLNSARNFLYSIPKKSNNTVQLNDKFFNSLIRSYGDAGLFQESVKVFKAMKLMGISPSTVTFNSLFMILMKRGKVGMVFELYDEMLRTYGVKPDVYTFNLLIRGFCMNLKIDEAFRMFKEIEKFECEPDLVTYNTIVDGLCRAGKVSVALNVLNGMRNKGEKLRPNVVSYTTLIRGYCEKQEIDKAVDLFGEMINSGIKPTEITFNIIIQGLCESQKFHMIKEILAECLGGGVEFVPDTCTFNTMMNTHCIRKNLDEALEIFKKMEELKVKPDSATYSLLIRAFCQKGNFEKAQDLLDELFEKEILLRDDGCAPLAAAYNPIFDYLCKNGKTKKAERVFRQLMKSGMQDPPAYKTLILGHCKEGSFVDGYKLLLLMLRRNFKPDVEIYESLIDGLLQKEEPTLAHDTLEKMLRSNHLPRTSMFHRVLMELIKKSSVHESFRLLILMLDKEIRTNINLSTDTVQVLFMKGSQVKAFKLLRSLNEKGYLINMKELILFLCENKKLVEAYKLLMFCLENDEKADIDVCDTVLSGLCKVHRLSEAFQLYYELLEKGIQNPFSCLEDLRSGLEADGKSKETEFIAKRMMN